MNADSATQFSHAVAPDGQSTDKNVKK